MIIHGRICRSTLITAGFPYPIDKVSKEIFKRLYHNMAYLLRKKVQ